MSIPEWTRASRVARRASFGANGATVDQVVATGVDTWVTQALTPGAADPGVAATPAPSLPPVPPLPDNATQAQRQERNKLIEQRRDAVETWWLARMLKAKNPVPERVTFGWHDHWATSASKVRDSRLMLKQNETLRATGLRSFTDMAHAMVVDPAMLEWLDGRRNVKGSPNENLARELMELFCLGVGGGYSEQDVKEAARALTGWRVSDDGSAVLEPKRFDAGAKTVFGKTGPLDAHGLVDLVLAQPAHPRFLASRWWRQLASEDAPGPDVIARLVAAYGPGRDSRALLRALLLDPGFVAARGTLVLAPVDWLVGSARALGVPATDATVTEIKKALRQLGQVPLQPPNVAGWPHGAAWLSTASAQTRAAVAQRLVKAADIRAVADQPAAQRVDAAVHLLGLPSVTARTRDAMNAAGGRPADLVATLLISPDYLVV